MRQKSKLLATALAGSWRRELPACALNAEEFESISTLLLASGAGALGWRRIQHSALQASSSAVELNHASRVQILQAALFEREIERVFSLLRGAGVEPLLLKGWAAARAYAEPEWRPCGDIDLLVRPEQRGAAQRALQSLGTDARAVDLHSNLMELSDRSVDDLFARSQLLRLGDTGVRVLAAEDHFGLLCIHLLRHGAWRPVWLCDVGASLEARPANFDWTLCLGANRRRARWIACAVGLAHQLLGARVAETPFAKGVGQLPRWLLADVLRQWETPYVTMQAPMRYGTTMSGHLRRPRGLPRALRQRWPGPTEATISVRGPFNHLPRWPFQLANCCARTMHFLTTSPFARGKSEV